MKSPNPKLNQKVNFNFESKSNHIAFMLDLSPYMLIYNYGSKALPVKNMQEITVHLLKGLVQRYKRDKTY